MNTISTIYSRQFLRLGLTLLAMLALSACSSSIAPRTGPDNSNITAESFNPARIKADMTFLADDTLEGRETGSRGYRVAANYVAAEFARLGLKPKGENGFFQEVPFQTAQLNQDTASMIVRSQGHETSLTLGDDFYMGGSVKKPSGSASGQVVFLGYGIYAPKLGHDDLKGMDLEGKIALIISGAPEGFQTEIRAHHGSTSTKLKELLKRGIAGLISVNSPAMEKRRPFKRLKRFLGRKRFDWVMPEDVGVADPMVGASAAISRDVALKLFEGASTSFSEAVASTSAGKFASMALLSDVQMKRDSILSDRISSPNVIAVLEGSDPTLKDEYVVISAHLDHIGITEHAKGNDKINNGALDNAAGVSVMLEVARAYVQANHKPRRSILFAAVTAEEKGLLGAEYFARFPTVEKSSMVANVNLDMPVLLYDFTDVVAFGADRSSLGAVTEKAVGKIGLGLSPDPMPQEGIFTRSDHYRFVQQGIPAVFLVTGWGKTEDGEDGGKIFMQFLGKTYHTPQDQLDLPINYQAGAKFAYVNWLITSAIANEDARPSWNEGDFFGDTFAGQ